MTKRIIAALILISVAASVTLADSGFPRSSLERLRAVRRAGLEPPTTEGLISYWSMRATGTTVHDEHGSTDGTAQAGISFGTEYGVRDDGAKFSGRESDSGIDVTGLSSTAKSYTFSTWLKLVENPSGANLNRGYLFDVQTGRMLISLNMRNNNGGFDKLTYWDGSAKIIGDLLPTGEWLHLVFVMDSTESEMRTYLNGELYGDIVTYADRDIGATVRLGKANPNEDWDVINGSMDEFRVYGRALTPAEITNAYNWDKAGAGH